MSTYVLCDLNVGDRTAVTRNVAIASSFAKLSNSILVGWVATPAISRFMSGSLRAEAIDFEIISKRNAVEAQLLVPRMLADHFRPGNIVALLGMLFTALIDPLALARRKAFGLNLGQMAVDSQRRMTLSISVKRFPRYDLLGHAYPALQSNSPKAIRPLTQSIFRYVVQAWFLAVFWKKWLSVHAVCASFQMHVERAEFQIVTNTLNRNKIPVFTTFGFLSEEYETKRRRLIKKLGLAEADYKDQRRVDVNPVQTSSEGKSLKGVPWTVGERYTHSSNNSSLVDLHAYFSALGEQKCYVIVLPAIWEAFNHAKPNRYLHNFRDLFLSVQTARAGVGSAGMHVWLKPHPFEPDHTWPHVRKEIRELATAVFGAEFRVLSRQISWRELEPLKEQLCVVSISSTSIVEAAELGFTIVACELNEYDLFEFASAPKSIDELIVRLSKKVDYSKAPISQVEAAIYHNHVDVWYEPLDWSPLSSGNPAQDLNKSIGGTVTPYHQSSKGLILTDRSLNECQARAHHAAILALSNRA